MRRFHITWARSAQYQPNKQTKQAKQIKRVNKIYSDPRAQWNPTNYLNKYATFLSTSFSSPPTHEGRQAGMHVHTHVRMHAGTHARAHRHTHFLSLCLSVCLSLCLSVSPSVCLPQQLGYIYVCIFAQFRWRCHCLIAEGSSEDSSENSSVDMIYL